MPSKTFSTAALEGVLASAGRFQEAAAQHGREAERDEAGDQNGHADGYRELVEQAAHDAAHEQHGDEHGRQRERHGENGEADLAGALDCRLHARLAHLDVAHDVFQNHDGVVHHEAHGERQRHQGEVVQRVAAQAIARERADHRHGQRQAGNDGGGDVAQEQEDHHHHQRDGEQQRELDVVDGFANRLRPVVEDIELDRGRHLFAETWEAVP